MSRPVSNSLPVSKFINIITHEGLFKASTVYFNHTSRPVLCHNLIASNSTRHLVSTLLSHSRKFFSCVKTNTSITHHASVDRTLEVRHLVTHSLLKILSNSCSFSILITVVLGVTRSLMEPI